MKEKGNFDLPAPRSSLTAKQHITQWAISKYGHIFNLVTWFAKSKKASGSIIFQSKSDRINFKYQNVKGPADRLVTKQLATV